MPRHLFAFFFLMFLNPFSARAGNTLNWESLPPLPGPEGMGGPFVGMTGGRLIVAGGASFPVDEGGDRWSVPKVWHRDVFMLQVTDVREAAWERVAPLEESVAYGASATIPLGVVCLGGEDSEAVSKRAFLLRWDEGSRRLAREELPGLPVPVAYAAVTSIGNTVYIAGGQTGKGLDSVSKEFWQLDLSKWAGEKIASWKRLPDWPGAARALPYFVAQHDGFGIGIFLAGGRTQAAGSSGVEGIEVLDDLFEFLPSSGEWRKRASLPMPLMGGAGAAIGQSHIVLLGGADGSLIAQTDTLKDNHPGFRREILLYHTITDTWTSGGETPATAVTTPAVKNGEMIYLVSGEIRPRKRTTDAWQISAQPQKREGFGAWDFAVLILYLAAMVGVGWFFMRDNANTDDFFRGGQRVPWWVAGCSIFATMLSSITFMAIPAKAYAQDWVLLLASLTVPLVAPFAVFVALPYFRKVDAASAYEYLERRFNRAVRLLSSGLFTVFHIFRIGIVLSLAGLALTTLTPLTPIQSVLLMGALSILYSTMGGLSAVVWTDTIQTFVLLGAALLCLGLIMFHVDGGLGGIVQIAAADGKLNAFNFDFSPGSAATFAVWVVVLGGLGQQVSSYTADQAVVQRYMSTPDTRSAARAIWTNAVLVVPSSLLFFGIGTALYTFYKLHPGKLDPTINTDQIFPLFITTEVPAGVAGLVVAGIFAAAQSTVSTSMNSTATTVVTDFMRPFNILRSETAYLRAGQILTVALGAAGTLIGLFFVNPAITSLFDSFLTVIGLFMGVLGGIFLLGMLTKRANGVGALTGACVALGTLLVIRANTDIHWMLYATIGIVVCFVVGMAVSVAFPGNLAKPHPLSR